MGSRPDWDDIFHKFRAAEVTAGEATRKKCEEVVKLWNEMVRVRRDPDPSPTVSVAVTAGYRWLQVYCPGCRSMSQVDLDATDVHPKARLSALIPRLSCSRCPRAPLAKLKGIRKSQWTYAEERRKAFEQEFREGRRKAAKE